ncbi:hypothetical protein MRX96_000535 [Rhipicephalus microplus]
MEIAPPRVKQRVGDGSTPLYASETKSQQQHNSQCSSHLASISSDAAKREVGIGGHALAGLSSYGTGGDRWDWSAMVQTENAHSTNNTTKNHYDTADLLLSIFIILGSRRSYYCHLE